MAQPESPLVDPDHRARDVQDVAHAKLVHVAYVAIHGHAAAALGPHVVGPETQAVEQIQRGVGEPLEVVGHRQVLDDVRFPGKHGAAVRVHPGRTVHGDGL